MASRQPPGEQGAKGGGAQPQPLSADFFPKNAVVESRSSFPEPSIYFKVYESEEDEPEAKIRRDVGKLYERWQAKYGRRWPENGMNTEDLVWLAEEAYKPEIPGASGQAPTSAQLGLVPLEKEAYPGEFISEPGADPDDGAAAKGQGKSKKKKARPAMSNYEATAAGGNWVTDEFESVDYEAGNLEQAWDMYLWDREGKPIMMPEGGPNEAAGEESEEWDDFLGSYRPRHVDTDDAREAVWATDEFESDEDNTESEWEPEYVGAGLGLQAEDPINPQYSLRHSNHPLAPFPGEPLKWSSFVYDDGTTYEGLTRDAVPHGMGVLIMGNGTGGGFHMRDVRRGDKYEGEFQAGYAHGLGQFTSEGRGEVYIGEFFAGQRHGCGIRIDMSAYNYLLSRGEDPVVAYQKTHDKIMRNIEFRTWYRNKALGSDHEDEVVLHAVRDDLDDPLAVVLRNARHEAKLKDWAEMDALDKALTKAVEIIEQVGADRLSRRSAQDEFRLRAGYIRGGDGRVHEAIDSDGNDTDFDSVELMVGVDTDGGPGLGWANDTADSEQFPYDSKLAEAINEDVLEDKLEESEDKEMILGDDILNPFTGLSVRDYLDGREGKYNELLRKTGALQKLKYGSGRPKPSEGAGAGDGAKTTEPLTKLAEGVEAKARRAEARRSWLAEAADEEGSSYVEAAQDDEELQRVIDSQLSRAEQEFWAQELARRAQYADDDEGGLPRVTNGRNPFEEGTDTRFETESEMMELCELAEILGTVDEAKEVVAKARMWRWKPDGEVTLRFAQDAQGAPVPLMQDPLHYPHGTKFMAPGPLGQCHPIPDDVGIRQEMLQAAQNYAHIYSLYNFDYDPEPGTAQWRIDQRIKRAAELRMQSLARMAEAAEEEVAAPAGQQVQELASVAEAPLASGSPVTQAGEHGPGSGRSSSTSNSPAAAGAAANRMWPPLPFASMGMSGHVSLGRASRVVLDALTSAAKAVPTRRPRLLRPTLKRKQPAGARPQQQ